MASMSLNSRSFRISAAVLLPLVIVSGCKRRVANLATPDPGGSYKIEWVHVEVPPAMKAQQITSIRVSIRNAGDKVIPGELFALAYHWMDAADPKRTIVWDGLRAAVGRSLQPGEAFSTVMRVKGPDLAGRYILNLDAVHEGVAWFSGRGSPMSSHEVTVE
jgi:transposase InsO family protein